MKPKAPRLEDRVAWIPGAYFTQELGLLVRNPSYPPHQQVADVVTVVITLIMHRSRKQ